MTKGYIQKIFCILFRGVSLVCALVLSILFIPLGWIAIFTDQYANLSIFVSLIPLSVGEYLRYFYYKFTLTYVGKKVVFKYGTFCQYNDTVIGNRVVFGYYNAIGLVTIGDDVITGGFVNFLSGTHQHSYNDPDKKICAQDSAGLTRISIGSDVWIGSNCVIANDVGSRCVIGTGSVVIKKTEEHGLYAGNPAKFLKKI